MVHRAQGCPGCGQRMWDRDGTLEMDRENKGLFITAESMELKEDTSLRIPCWGSGKSLQFSRAGWLGRTAASHARHMPLPGLRGCLSSIRKTVSFHNVLTRCS